MSNDNWPQIPPQGAKPVHKQLNLVKGRNKQFNSNNKGNGIIDVDIKDVGQIDKAAHELQIQPPRVDIQNQEIANLKNQVRLLDAKLKSAELENSTLIKSFQDLKTHLQENNFVDLFQDRLTKSKLESPCEQSLLAFCAMRFIEIAEVDIQWLGTTLLKYESKIPVSAIKGI